MSTDYIPGIEYEPSVSTDALADVYVPGEGPICDAFHCTQPQGIDPTPRREITLNEDRYVGEKISALQPFPEWQPMFVTIIPRILLQGGGGSNPLEPQLRARPDPAERECDTGETLMDEAEPALEDMWNDTDFSELRVVRQRSSYRNTARETAILIRPDGSIIDLISVGAAGSSWPCNFFLYPSIFSGLDVPPGTLFVHTHPWSVGDDQLPACGDIFGNPPRLRYRRPGTGDAAALSALQNIHPGIRGAVLDGDGIYFYDSDDGQRANESDRCY